MSAPRMRSPAPSVNAEKRAEVVCKKTSSPSIHRPEPEADFATTYLARRFSLPPPLTRVLAALVNLGRALG
jgi:hypothetical protein